MPLTPAATALPPGTTAEGRRRLAERIALFGKVVFGLCFGFFLVVQVIMALVPPVDMPAMKLSDRPNLAHLAACAALLSIWQVAQRGRLGTAGLQALDALGTVGVCGAYAAMWLPGPQNDANPILLAATNTLIARALLVPSSALRTLAVTLAGSLPVAAVGFLSYAASGQPAGSHAGLEAIFLCVWLLVSLALTTIGSHVIYGLRREIIEARRLGQYTLEAKLGAGGMGEVYRARHAMLKRPTAIKLLPPERAGEQSLLRFEREVQLTSQLTHPNTIAIHDYGRTPDGTFYYAMEYLDGIDLQRLVAEHGAQPNERVRALLIQVCGALEEAHRVGLIHRDIKPANVILCQRGGVTDVAKVVDFGLVKDLEADRDPQVSRADTLTGTPLYMAPEMIRGDAVDARSDLYSLGAVGYWLLAAAPVFSGASLVEICGHHLHTAPPPIAERTDRPVAKRLEQLLLGCLDKDPGERPASAAELSAELQALGPLDDWDDARARAWWQSWSARRQAATAGELDGAPTIDVDLAARWSR